MKKLVALLLAGVMTLSLAACGNQSSKSEDKKETSKSEETVEISFWHAMSGANEEAIQKITDDFMKENPNIKVNLMNQGDYLDLFDKLMASSKAKQLPNLAQIYSNLYQSIQDVFAEADVEIMSPHYMAVRDGNETTIPKSGLKPEETKEG